jgi:protein-L-isoaspartate(D-aspartate) O-methyltransferase
MNTDFARRQMVEQQVRAWDVLDTEILELLIETPREQFVPSGFESLAFADTEIPIGHGQRMMTPTLEGRVLQSLKISKADSVLEIGTGSGYLTACIAKLADSVTSIDVHEDFLEAAAANLEDSGISNFELTAMDATQRLPEGEFDAIVITGSMQVLHPRYELALKPTGRLFVVVGHRPTMDARLLRRTGDSSWLTKSLFETELDPLVNSAQPPQFSF